VIARVAGLALLVPLASALRSDAIPLTLRLLLVAFWILAIVRPHAALVALTLLVPVGSLMAAFVGTSPPRDIEVIVRAALSGTLIAFARPPERALQPQRPSLVPPAVIAGTLLCAAAAVTFTATYERVPLLRDVADRLWREYLSGQTVAFMGVYEVYEDAVRLVEGLVLMIVVARHTRDAVTRPAQLVAVTAFAGALAAFVVLETQVHVSLHASSFFVMAAFVAIALAMNRRHTRVPRHPRVRRALWIGAAALMIVSMWAGGSRMAPAAPTHDVLQTAGPARVAALAAFAWLLGAMAMRLARGLRADPGDRLLLGCATALAAFLVIWMTSYPSIVPEIAFPFWILAGAALTRADGDAQPPYAASPGSVD